MPQSRNNRYDQRSSRNAPIRRDEQEWTCVHCQLPVSSDPSIAGVQNRNHCPYCLWSRHLDAHAAGDRLAACRAGMEPIGLTVKRRRNKYATDQSGELMIIHRCINCDKIDINRIAADDSTTTLLEVFDASASLSESQRAELTSNDITLLGPDDKSLVHRQLFGTAPEQ